MSLQMKGSIPANKLQETRTYDTSYLTGWTELSNFTGFQFALYLADFDDEDHMRQCIKLFFNQVSPNWFIVNGGDGDTFCVLQMIVERNRWDGASLRTIMNRTAGGTILEVGGVFPWTGVWNGGLQPGYDGGNPYALDNLSSGALSIRRDPPAGFENANGDPVLDSAADIAHYVRDYDQVASEPITVFPTSGGLSDSDRAGIRCAQGVQSLGRDEAIEYDVVYQQGTDAGFISFINWDIDGIILDVGGSSSTANGDGNIGQASADWHVKGSYVEFLLSEIKPLAYTCNFNGDRLNSAGFEGTGEQYAMISQYGLVMMIDRPIGEIVDILKRGRHVVEETLLADDVDNTASGSQVSKASASKWWSRNYDISAAAAADLSGYADNTDVLTDSTGDADDVLVYQLPPFFADASIYLGP